MLQLLTCGSPVLWTITMLLIGGLIGALIGAWYQSKPISDAEMRAEIGMRHCRKFSDEEPHNEKGPD